MISLTAWTVGVMKRCEAPAVACIWPHTSGYGTALRYVREDEHMDTLAVIAFHDRAQAADNAKYT